MAADPLGHSTDFSYDALGRVTGRVDPLGNATSMSYDAADEATSVTDPLGHTTSFQYDALGRRTQITDANGHSSTTSFSNLFGTRTECDALNNCANYAYNSLGELTQSQGPLGATLDFSYDGLNRVTTVSSSGSSSSSFSYDVLNRVTQMTGAPLGNLSFSWDLLDRLTQEQQYAGTVRYAYDAAGNRTSMAAGDQATVTYAYDRANRLTSLSNGTMGASIAYDGDGRRLQLNLPDAVTANYAYDADSHLTSISYSQSGASLGNLSYSYDPDGRRASLSGSLANVQAPTGMTATYAANNQIATYNGQAVGSDAAGHITADPSTGDSFTWSDGALSVVQNPGSSSVGFQYDELGRRVNQSFGAYCLPGWGLMYATSTLYDGLVPVQQRYSSGWAEFCPSDNPPTETNLLTLPGSGEVLGLTESGDIEVPLHDALGSTVALAGSSTYNYTYSAFGSSTQSGGPWCDSLDPCPPFWYPYRFTGREWSDVAGISQLYYTWARYYSPGLRRFISSDPMGFAGSGSNLYAYVGDDPVNATDPLGLMGFFAALADLFTGVMSGDFTWAVSCADFFTCLGAVAATEFGSFLRVATSTSGGGRQAPASAPPALTGSELSARLAQRPGFAPTRNNYTPAPPGRHFDPRYLITVADAPVPSGIIGVQFWGWNYCGPGNNGGSASPGTTDYCCELHDLCYGSGGLSGKDVLQHFHGRGAGALQKACDAMLCGCVNGLGGSSGPYDLLIRQGIRSVFCY